MTPAARPPVTDDAHAWETTRCACGHSFDPHGLGLTLTERIEIYAIHVAEVRRMAAGRAETTTATTEGAARVLYESGTGFKLTKGKPWEELAESSRNSQRRLAQALADAGLLATARTHPTRTIYSVQHWEDADGIRASWVTGYGQYTHSHEDAEATLRHQERQHPDTTFRLAQAEVTAWTETGQ